MHQQEFEGNILEILFFIFFLKVLLELSFLPLWYKHEILGLDVLIDHFHLVLSPFIQVIDFELVLSGGEVDVDSELIVALSTGHGLDVENLLSDRLLLALEQITQFHGCHHLTTAIDKLDQHNTLVFQVLIKLVVLFLQRGYLVVLHDLLVLL